VVNKITGGLRRFFWDVVERALKNNRTHFTMRRLRQKPNFKVRPARGGKPPRRSWFFSEAGQKEEGRK
jgi:hypothetical protein